MSLINGTCCCSSLQTLQKHKKASIWRKKPFPLYDSIQILVDGIIATGEKAFRAGITPQSSVPAIDATIGDFANDISASDHKGGNTDEVCVLLFYQQYIVNHYI